MYKNYEENELLKIITDFAKYENTKTLKLMQSKDRINSELLKHLRSTY